MKLILTWSKHKVSITNKYSYSYTICLECLYKAFFTMAYSRDVTVHSFSSLSYDRSKASSKASSPHSAI